MNDWDSREVASAFERFCRDHTRYQEANAALVAHARLEGDLRVLDVAAGTGHTAEAALPLLGPGATLVCFESAAAMRSAGEARVDDARVAWTDELPEGEMFDRVLCGGAIWALGPLEETVARLRGLLAPGGALAFDIPALYLGEPDEPGGGRDPLLLELPALLADGRVADGPPGNPLPTSDRVSEILGASDRWELRRRMTQAELRDWLRIPLLTPHLSSAGRDHLIDEAYTLVDPDSWRWETWLGWTT